MDFVGLQVNEVGSTARLLSRSMIEHSWFDFLGKVEVDQVVSWNIFASLDRDKFMLSTLVKFGDVAGEFFVSHVGGELVVSLDALSSLFVLVQDLVLILLFAASRLLIDFLFVNRFHILWEIFLCLRCVHLAIIFESFMIETVFIIKNTRRVVHFKIILASTSASAQYV